MDFPDAILKDRLPVWEALSELFLDTQLDEQDLQFIANTLKQSPYSLNQLDAILYDEVYPVCVTNLLSVAGIWSGFDMDWLQAAIIKKQQKKSYWQRFGSPHWAIKRIRLHRWMIQEEWEEIKRLISI